MVFLKTVSGREKDFKVRLDYNAIHPKLPLGDIGISIFYAPKDPPHLASNKT